MKISPLISALAFFFLFLCSPAIAGKPSTAPDVQVKLSPAMEKKDMAFNKLRKKLTKEQDALVIELEQRFISTLDPELQVMKLQSNMAACEFEKEEEKIQAEEKLSAFREWSKKKQIILWGTFEKEQMSSIDFMEHDMLREHLAMKLHIAKATASQLIRMNATKVDINTRCQQAKNTLAGITLVSGRKPAKEQEKQGETQDTQEGQQEE